MRSLPHLKMLARAALVQRTVQAAEGPPPLRREIAQPYRFRPEYTARFVEAMFKPAGRN